jgi:hypothetical protein
MTTVTFSRILQTGMSFLGVSIAITVIFTFLNSIGILLVSSNLGDVAADSNESSELMLVGILFIMLAFSVFIAGSIGIIQKLVSDAFLEGFIAARDSKNPISEKKMGVFETLKSGFQVIGIIVLTLVISGFILGLGVIFQAEFGDFGVLIGSLLYGLSCALVLAISIGMLTMILAEGVFTGAKNSGITFVNSADSSTEKSNMANENIQPSDTEEENYPEENSSTDEDLSSSIMEKSEEE